MLRSAARPSRGYAPREPRSRRTRQSRAPSPARARPSRPSRPPCGRRSRTSSLTQPDSSSVLNQLQTNLVRADARGRLGADEERLDVAVVEVLSHVAADDLFVLFEEVEVAVAHLRGHFVADVEELAQARVIERIRLVVAERADVLLGSPALDLFGRGKLRAVDVDDGRVGRAERVDVGERLGVNLPGELQALAARLGEADDLFEPGRAGGLDVDAGSRAGERAADGLVDGELVA